MTNFESMRRGLRRGAVLLLIAALPVAAQGPGGGDPAKGEAESVDECAGSGDTVEDPTQVAFCWNPADAESGPPDPVKKPVSPPGIKAPKEKRPGDPPNVPKGPASGSKVPAFRPK